MPGNSMSKVAKYFAIILIAPTGWRILEPKVNSNLVHIKRKQLS